MTKQMLTELDPTLVSDASVCPNALGYSTVGEIFGFQTLCHRVREFKSDFKNPRPQVVWSVPEDSLAVSGGTALDQTQGRGTAHVGASACDTVITR